MNILDNQGSDTDGMALNGSRIYDLHLQTFSSQCERSTLSCNPTETDSNQGSKVFSLDKIESDIVQFESELSLSDEIPRGISEYAICDSLCEYTKKCFKNNITCEEIANSIPNIMRNIKKIMWFYTKVKRKYRTNEEAIENGIPLEFLRYILDNTDLDPDIIYSCIDGINKDYFIRMLEREFNINGPIYESYGTSCEYTKDVIIAGLFYKYWFDKEMLQLCINRGYNIKNIQIVKLSFSSDIVYYGTFITIFNDTMKDLSDCTEETIKLLYDMRDYIDEIKDQINYDETNKYYEAFVVKGFKHSNIKKIIIEDIEIKLSAINFKYNRKKLYRLKFKDVVRLAKQIRIDLSKYVDDY